VIDRSKRHSEVDCYLEDLNVESPCLKNVFVCRNNTILVSSEINLNFKKLVTL
jgi:hypothetical protein